jgi:putative transcriptional regulator
MSNIKAIRDQLGLTQAALGVGIGCTQGNIGHYEARAQTVPPHVAKRLIAYAKQLGHTISFDDVYGAAEARQGDPSPAEHES